VIWLELQAWFAGKDVTVTDQWIINERKQVDQVSEMISNYK
jgi:hypothetical protein